MSDKKRKPRKKISDFDNPKVKWIEKHVDPEGGLISYIENGKRVWKKVPLRTGVRKASKKEAREIMKQAREGLGLLTIGKKRRA